MDRRTSPNQPHSALSNPAVLTRIFQHASSRSLKDSACRKNDTVAKCARVCRPFREPALRVLWGRVPSVLPLLRLLVPCFGRIQYDHKNSECTHSQGYVCYALHDLPGPVEWARFCHYAPYVRILHCDMDPVAHLDYEPLPRIDDDDAETPENVNEHSEYPHPAFILPSVWFHLKELSNGRPLFPNLRELVWLASPFAFDFLEVLSPTLQTIHIRLITLHAHTDQEWKASLPLFIRSVASLAPMVQHCEIVATQVHPVHTLLPEVHRMTHLRHLALDTNPLTARRTNAQTLREAKLDTLEALESLKLGIWIKEYSPTRFPPIALRSLRAFTVVDYFGCPEAYTLFHARRLATLDITLHRSIASTQTEAYRAVPAVIARHFPRIISLALRLHTSCDFPGDKHPLDLHKALEPLHRLSHLRELTIVVRGTTLTAASTEVRPFLVGLPRLTALTIDLPRLQYGVATIATATVLVDLARFGTELQRCHLGDLLLSPSLLDHVLVQAATVSPPNTNLTMLSVDRVEYGGDLYVKHDMARCAKLLYELFPNLDCALSRAAPPNRRTAFYGTTNGAWNNCILTVLEHLRREIRTIDM
ncbi:hypothetical protein C8Q77DRAFT_272681 [Trametes polyzona]|nr:hypothetical protein C8Q77DRAFT_272681 [Trametes polyzona]